MSKINNVGLNLGQKIANPFKTSRNITTPNPFKYSNFEGNSLPFADVFEGFEPKKTGKMKMIASSVAGSMTKVRSLIPESIVNFVSRIGEGLSNAWAYAKNTPISEVHGIKEINKVMNTDIVDIGKGITKSMSGVGNTISDKMSFLNKDIKEFGINLPTLNIDLTGMGKSLSAKWTSLIGSIDHGISTKGKSVDELKAMWLNENEILAAKEAERVAA